MSAFDPKRTLTRRSCHVPHLEQSVGSAPLCGLQRQPVYLALHQLPIETFVAHEKIRRSVLDDPAGL
jgi:hypothetical protein